MDRETKKIIDSWFMIQHIPKPIDYIPTRARVDLRIW